MKLITNGDIVEGDRSNTIGFFLRIYHLKNFAFKKFSKNIRRLLTSHLVLFLLFCECLFFRGGCDINVAKALGFPPGGGNREVGAEALTGVRSNVESKLNSDALDRKLARSSLLSLSDDDDDDEEDAEELDSLDLDFFALRARSESTLMTFFGGGASSSELSSASTPWVSCSTAIFL